ncbi:hypothetical protein JX265_004223 [Neoarthrinium moseri]|uniref:Uncharacterized protein n=1 Tax=Neoarthrinium moseri TaxID=1658444 RepID=A0A9P9WQK1_9PEZI|nr:hypothetical protein JX266_005988 [Neoarthrinium moseri]KAI1875165.1 hypothetical protein JX265_004223 [Neoarthrinium moseri]
MHHITTLLLTMVIASTAVDVSLRTAEDKSGSSDPIDYGVARMRERGSGPAENLILPIDANHVPVQPPHK